MSKDFLADALPKRPAQKTNKYQSNGGFSSSLEATRVTVTNSTTGGKYTAPTLDGEEFDRMRRYGLVLARWSLPDHHRRAKKEGLPVACYESANRVVANAMFVATFDEDPTKDTVNLTPYVNVINSGKISPELIHNVAGFIESDAYKTICSAIIPTEQGLLVKAALEYMASEIHDYCFKPRAHYTNAFNGLHSKHPRNKRIAAHGFDYIARVIDSNTQALVRKLSEGKATTQKPKYEKPTTPKRTRLDKLPSEYGWCEPYLAKYPLELPHTGKLGRRTIATNEGKYPKNFHRLVTDPFRRIFVRKTRSLGGVVVFDCSGSMGLSEEQIKQVLKSSAGCSIVCYSDHGNEDQDKAHGNIHLVAKNGRQMRGLPDFPGGNGVDLPALRYGYDILRLNGRSPVIWVSDGQVTGIRGNFNDKLEEETTKFIKRRGIHHVTTPEAAILLLHKLQRGIKK